MDIFSIIWWHPHLYFQFYSFPSQLIINPFKLNLICSHILQGLQLPFDGFSICNLMRSLLAIYKQWLKSRPIPTKSITCSILFTLGDYIAQQVEKKTVKLQWDTKRTINFAMVGLVYYGPALHLWYCKILPKIADRFFKDKTKAKRVLGSVMFDQILFTPIFYCGYFLADSIIEQRSIWNGLKSGIVQIRQKIIQTIVADLLVWPLATTINLWYIPLYYQVLYVNIICLFWDIALCHITKENCHC